MPFRMITFAQFLTLAAALLASSLLWALGAPLPFLFGSLGTCLIGSVLGFPTQGMPLISTVSRTVLGVAIGASITTGVLAQLGALAPTLLLVPIYVAVIAFTGMHYFHHVMGYDKTTAYYAAMPGALQDMVVFGDEAGGNTRALSLIHATRLLLMVSIAPVLMTVIFNTPLDNPLGPPTKDLPFYHVFWVLFIGIAGWKLAAKVNIFGASVTGPLLLAIPLSLMGLLTERPSQEVINIAQFFIGIGIGVYYRGITPAEIRRDILAASGFVIILLIISTIITFIASSISNLPVIELFLAFWPAGQAEIAVLSLAAGANVGIIVLHHLIRVVIVILGAPTVAKLLKKQTS